MNYNKAFDDIFKAIKEARKNLNNLHTIVTKMIGQLDFKEEWNKYCPPFRKIKVMNAKRKQSFYARLKDPYWAEHWQEALYKISKIPGMTGNNDRNWIADVEFFLRPTSLIKIMEGKYDAWGKEDDRIFRT